MCKRLRHLGYAALVAMAAVWATPQAAAQTATYLTPDASECEMWRAMSRVIPAACDLNAQEEAPLTRGLDLSLTRSLVPREPNQSGQGTGTNSAVYSTPEPQAPVVQQNAPDTMGAAMQILFEFDSDRLTQQATITLDRMAAVLGNQLMSGAIVQIEGHADSTGAAG